MVTVDHAMTHDEVQNVLPWFANKRLDADTSRRVAAHLEVCPICRNDVDGLTAAFTANERSLPERAVDESRLDALFARIDRHEAQRHRQLAEPARRSILSQVKLWFAAHPGFAAGSLASVLLAVVVVPAVLQQPNVGHEYSVLSSTQEDVERFAIRMQFRESMQSSDVDRMVASAKTQTTQLPTYRIEQRSATEFMVVFDGKPSVASTSELLQRLSTAPSVASATIDTAP